ncbi:MAG: valine--tRNA ligase [Planctomycetaceae bacterium]|nr:valine--tRNA ligase [Planctomycetaceae bacterium]
MPAELAKIFEPKAVETDVYSRWIKQRAFAADPAAAGESYCIVIPPPNVTAALHLGHALNNTLQDVLIRFRRMQQYNTLWMPGTDHAGIATQTVVEKRILAEEGKRRTDFAREDFIARVQAWKDEYEKRIINQLELMGCSCDWDRTRFTMDEVCARAVRETFFRLFADGLIYRGKRLVNWDVATQTVLADDEVEHETVQGNFYYLKYPLAHEVVAHGMRFEAITVATTRPETMLGDTAIAMNPRDPRAAALVGQMVRLPIVGRLIPIIADEHVVLPNPESEDEKARFSTGFLKVTPAHDPDDYAIRERRNAACPEAPIDIINVLAPDGTISDKHGWTDWDTVKNPDVENIVGMDRFEAREAVVEFFRREKLLEDVRPYTHEVGHSYRSHVPIEPYLSDQWYVAVKKPISNFRFPISNLSDRGLAEERDRVTYLKDTDVPVNSLAGLALAPLMDGRVKFTPDRYATNYRTWLENLRDWPISRQLWWGHQIPVWSGAIEKFSWFVSSQLIEECRHASDDSAPVIVSVPGRSAHEGVNAALQARNTVEGTIGYLTVPPGCEHIEKQLEEHGLVRDADVLDTWFSSALWPFSTLGWPEQTDALKKYYPGDVLCTAREIITLWVSRMVMMGQYCAGDIPFSDVFIHAMIQDGEGRKMSKSLGNGIDPLDIIDSHGADAMRFTLVSMTTQTQDVRMPVQKMKLPDGREVNSSPKFDAGRNFCNKLWNAARFAMMNIAGAPAWSQIRPGADLSDAWILSRLNATIAQATASIEAFRFNEVADTLYHFMWDEFCDWYLEIAKNRINAGQQDPKAVVAHCLDVLLRLMHPIIPFITEAIWQNLNDVCPVRGPGAAEAEPLLVRAQWPMADSAAINENAQQNFDLLQEIIRQVRNVRTQHNVPPSRRVDVAIEADGHVKELLTQNADLLRFLAQVQTVTFRSGDEPAPANAAAVVAGGAKLYVLDVVDAAAETARLTKQAQTLEKGIAGIMGKLANEKFVANARPDVVAKERQRLEQLQADLAHVQASLAALK